MRESPPGAVGQDRRGDIAQFIKLALNGPAERVDGADQFAVSGVFQLGPAAVRSGGRGDPPRRIMLKGPDRTVGFLPPDQQARGVVGEAGGGTRRG